MVKLSFKITSNVCLWAWNCVEYATFHGKFDQILVHIFKFICIILILLRLKNILNTFKHFHIIKNYSFTINTSLNFSYEVHRRSLFGSELKNLKEDENIFKETWFFCLFSQQILMYCPSADNLNTICESREHKDGQLFPQQGKWACLYLQLWPEDKNSPLSSCWGPSVSIHIQAVQQNRVLNTLYLCSYPSVIQHRRDLFFTRSVKQSKRHFKVHQMSCWICKFWVKPNF